MGCDCDDCVYLIINEDTGEEVCDLGLDFPDNYECLNLEYENEEAW